MQGQNGCIQGTPPALDRGGPIGYIAVMRGPGKMPRHSGDDRAGRLAEALRENLRRRKNQERARRAAAVDTGGAGTSGATDGREGGPGIGPGGGARDGRTD